MMAIVLFLLGLVLLLGPTVLHLFLAGCAAIQPVSGYVTVYLIVTLVLSILLDRVYKRVNFWVNQSGNNVAERKIARKWRVRVGKAATVVDVVAILSVLLISTNGLFVMMDNGWTAFMDDNSVVFSVLRYIGIVFIVASISFVIGFNYKRSRAKRRATKKVVLEVVEKQHVIYHDLRDVTPIPVCGEIIDLDLGNTSGYAGTYEEDKQYETQLSEEDISIQLPKSAKSKLV